MAFIIYAGFGVWDRTIDVTQLVRSLYASGTQLFTCGGCAINGLKVDDPASGARKYLFVVYSVTGQAPYESLVVGEDDVTGIAIPLLSR